MNKVAVVSGANQGLGFALVEALCRHLGPDAFVYLTARHPVRGEAAMGKLRDQGLSPIFHLLDVTDEASVAALAETIRARHGGVDIGPKRNSTQMTQIYMIYTDLNSFGSLRPEWG